MNKHLPKLIGATLNLTSYISPSIAAKIAVGFFSKPRKGKLNNEELKYLKSATQTDHYFNNFNIKTYRWKGNNDTILLVHGWESNTYRWKELIELLHQQDYNIITVDAPAHGQSGSTIFNAPLYAECLNVVVEKYKPQHIIGHSVGGTSVAIALKNYQHAFVEKIALLGAPSNLAISVKNYVNLMGYNARVANAINKHYLKHFGHLPEYYCVENFYKDLPPKGLIIHDKKDNIISFKEALDINRAYNNATLIKTIGLGHRLKSDKVYQHLIDFLKA